LRSESFLICESLLINVYGDGEEREVRVCEMMKIDSYGG